MPHRVITYTIVKLSSVFSNFKHSIKKIRKKKLHKKTNKLRSAMQVYRCSTYKFPFLTCTHVYTFYLVVNLFSFYSKKLLRHSIWLKKKLQNPLTTETDMINIHLNICHRFGYRRLRSNHTNKASQILCRVCLGARASEFFLLVCSK